MIYKKFSVKNVIVQVLLQPILLKMCQHISQPNFKTQSSLCINKKKLPKISQPPVQNRLPLLSLFYFLHTLTGSHYSPLSLTEMNVITTNHHHQKRRTTTVGLTQWNDNQRCRNDLCLHLIRPLLLIRPMFPSTTVVVSFPPPTPPILHLYRILQRTPWLLPSHMVLTRTEVKRPWWWNF